MVRLSRIIVRSIPDDDDEGKWNDIIHETIRNQVDLSKVYLLKRANKFLLFTQTRNGRLDHPVVANLGLGCVLLK